ncbi:MAG: ATP-binding protein, partial [Chlorobiales bacterium]|nr:ATP-binding protein [Chlorobiales bacterium]
RAIKDGMHVIALDNLLTGNIKNLEHLLDKLIEWRRYRTGEVTPNYMDIRLGVLTDPVQTVYDERAAEKGIQFNKYCPNSDFFIRTDPDRVRRLLRLLLDHAFDIDDVCSVEFTASVDTSTLQFTIAGETETGEEMRTNAEGGDGFEQKSDRKGKGRSRTEIPIKLPLARNIVDLLGGKLTVSSAGSQGTSFSVILPIKSH